MNNEQAKAAALAWHGEAGGELLPQLTANELAGIVNEALAQLVPVASVFRGGVPAFGKATAFKHWLPGQDELQDGLHTLYAKPNRKLT